MDKDKKPDVTPFYGHFTDCQKVKLPMPREFNGKKYYGLIIDETPFKVYNFQ